MTQDEIIEMAQECNLIGMRPHLDGIYSESLVAFAKLVAAKAIAELESQEPVGQLIELKEMLQKQVDRLIASNLQRTWVGLTDAEMLSIEETTTCTKDESWLRNVTRAIEAKLKEKNT